MMRMQASPVSHDQCKIYGGLPLRAKIRLPSRVEHAGVSKELKIAMRQLIEQWSSS